MIRRVFPDEIWGKDFAYRMAPLWSLPCLIVGLIFMILLYRTWKQLGGDTHYVPPGSDIGLNVEEKST